MKAFISSMIILFVFQTSLSQKIDFVNAPKNPIGFKWKKEHFFLKGDIYASAGKIFNKDGSIEYNYGTRYYYNNGKIIGNNYSDTFEYDNRGNIIKFQYKSGSATNYQYNDKDLLIYEKNTYGDEKKYTYDSQNRLIETIITKKGLLDQKRVFTYSKSNNTIIVSMTYTYANGRNSFRGTSHYINGFLIKEELSSGIYNYIVETDSKGNKINFKSADSPNPKEFKTFNRYYSDVNKPINIEYGYYKTSSTAKKTQAIYINGNRASDIAISKGVKPNEKIIYDGLTKTYYRLANVIPENHTENTRIPITDILYKGEPLINYVYDGKFINYVHGYNKVKLRNFAFLGPHMIDYREDKNNGITYIIDNYKNKMSQEVKVMRELSRDSSSIFYLRKKEKENFFIVVKGKHIDYKKASFEYLTNGDPIIKINEVPKYVLTGFRTADKGRIYKGKKYDDTNEKEIIPKAGLSSNTQNSISTNTDKTLNCIEGDCRNGWGRMQIGDITTDATFKNNAIHGVAYISYSNGAYYHGEYKNNQRDGNGYYKWATGTTYIGEWKNGKQHGYGITSDSTGKIISAGIFENGTLKTNLGESYKNNSQNGNCTGNCSNGFGKFKYSNGDIFIGFFNSGKRAHVGSYFWTNKSAYTGSYSNDGIRNGYGKYTYVDGSIFRGVYINDRINGLGIMKYAKTGNIVKGVFNSKGAKIKDY